MENKILTFFAKFLPKTSLKQAIVVTIHMTDKNKVRMQVPP